MFLRNFVIYLQVHTTLQHGQLAHSVFVTHESVTGHLLLIAAGGKRL
jgi:hypothetical protein